MGLFKKKEPRVVKDTDPLIIKLWYNKRTHAMIVLGAYFLFFVILLILVKVSSNAVKNDNTVDASFLTKDLIEKDIRYNVLYKNSSEMYLFSGAKNVEDKLVGTLTHDGNSLNISINDEECTISPENNEEENKCPEKIKYKYFDIKNLSDIIKDKKAIHYSSNKLYKYSINDKLEINLYYDDNKVLYKVVITEPNESFEINYSIINEDEL